MTIKCIGNHFKSSVDSTSVLIFTFSADVGIPCTAPPAYHSMADECGVPHCRLDGVLAKDCVYTGGGAGTPLTITMTLPK
jgi:hypothetical protein